MVRMVLRKIYIYRYGGYGVDKDYIKAPQYLRKAVDSGDADAAYRPGEMYYA